MSHPIDVDAIVRAVLEELARRNPGGKSETNGHASPPGGRGFVPETPVFAGRLLSQSNVESLDETVKVIRVAQGTIVTPLAADLLKRRGISLRFGSNGEASSRAKGTGTWAFAIEGPRSGKAEAVRRALLDAWAEVAAADLTPWIGSGPDRGALLLTPEASVACWRANRVEGIRAAAVCDVDAVARAIRHLGINLLVVEPASHPIPHIKAMAETFRKGGAPSMPEGLR